MPDPAATTDPRALAREAMERAERATPGPCIAVRPRDQQGATVGHTGTCYADDFPARTSIRSLGVSPDPTGFAPGGWEQAESDADLHAAAHTDVPALSSALEAAADRLDELAGALRTMRETAPLHADDCPHVVTPCACGAAERRSAWARRRTEALQIVDALLAAHAKEP